MWFKTNLLSPPQCILEYKNEVDFDQSHRKGRETHTHKTNTLLLLESPQSTPIPLPLEIEVQMQDSPLKCALEAFFVTVFPFFVDDAEGTVLVWRSSMNPAFTKEMLLSTYK